DVRRASTQILVHHDAIIDRQSRRLRQARVRRDTQSGHHAVYQELATAPGLERILAVAVVQLNHLLARQNLHTLFAVVAVEEIREVARIHRRANTRLREEHGHLLAIHGQGRGDLGADEAAANHRKALALLGSRAQPLIAGQGAEINDLVATE